MTSTQILVGLLGAVALLLWGIHTVSSGVQRAFGGELQRVLAIGLRNRPRAFLAGVITTSLLQSSTATALMVTSLSAGGAMELVPALAVMLGANVGTTLIVQLVSFDISLVYPLLLLLGVTLFRRGQRGVTRDLGTAIVGLGLMLLALRLLLMTMQPVENSQVLRDILHVIAFDPLINILLAAILAWAAHSSVAVMLFIMSLAGTDVITPSAAFAMVLGANLGSAFNPLIDVLGQEPERLRLPAGNLLNRLAGCLIVTPFISVLSSLVMRYEPSPARAAAEFHLAFNIAMAIACIGPLPIFARLLVWMFPTRQKTLDPASPLYLDKAALATPTVAVANAAREVMRMADVIGGMLRGSRTAFHQDDMEQIAAVVRMDDMVDGLYSAIQRYLGSISHELLSDEESRRVSEILALSINLEHVGDIIDRNLMETASKRIKLRLFLSDAEVARIDSMHDRLLEHLQLAIAVFMSRDVAAGRRLVSEKEQFRDIERQVTQIHFDRMRSGDLERIEASALQLDITRDLKRIEAHLAGIAYPLLEGSGHLRSSRLESSTGPDIESVPLQRTSLIPSVKRP